MRTGGAAVGVAFVIFTVAAAAQTAAPRTANDGVFSAAQATRGEDAYMSSCANCHGDKLVSTDQEAPSLTGTRFKTNWIGKTLDGPFKVIRTTMPATNPGALDDQTSADILAFILKFNGYPSGEQPLPTNNADLATIVVQPRP